MVLGAWDIALIVLITLVCTAFVVALTLLALHLARHQGITVQFTIVVGGAACSIIASSAAVMGQMYVSPHDLTVFVWVAGVSGVVSLTAAWLITRRTARRSANALIASAQQLGEGAVIGGAHDGWRAKGSRNETGAGLGLAIVRGIVEAHGGEVGADNLRDGFIVSLRLPV